MKLYLDRLDASLEKELAPVYLISGDEPLQVGEAADKVREAARRQGYSNRELYYVESGFDWGAFLGSAESYSLFGEMRVLDLRLPVKPDRDGAEALLRFARRLPEDAVLIVSLPRLTAAEQKAAWFQALDKPGRFVQIWPLEGRQFLDWLSRRMSAKGMLADQSGLRILAARLEGNLLAASQEIEKLHILYGPVRVDDEMIRKAVVDSARYDVYDLPEAVVKGQVGRTCRILAGLRAEGSAPAVVLWALSREARTLSGILSLLAEGGSLDAALSRHRIAEKAKANYSAAVQRLDRGKLALALLLCAKADRMIKGQEAGDVWEALRDICLCQSGLSDPLALAEDWLGPAAASRPDLAVRH